MFATFLISSKMSYLMNNFLLDKMCLIWYMMFCYIKPQTSKNMYRLSNHGLPTVSSQCPWHHHGVLYCLGTCWTVCASCWPRVGELWRWWGPALPPLTCWCGVAVYRNDTTAMQQGIAAHMTTTRNHHTPPTREHSHSTNSTNATKLTQDLPRSATWCP